MHVNAYYMAYIFSRHGRLIGVFCCQFPVNLGTRPNPPGPEYITPSEVFI